MKKSNLTYTRFMMPWISLCLLCIVLSACSGDNTETPTPAPPTEAKRVVSLAPSITEMLFALDQGDKVVGVTEYCDYPPEAPTREIIGGYATPSIEAIVRCSPDVVVLLKEHQDTRAQLAKLEKIGRASCRERV